MRELLMRKFKLKTINRFSQEKLIANNISWKQSCILYALFVMINNNVDVDGQEFRKTHIFNGETYYDFNQWEIIDAIPICKYKDKRQFRRDVAPLIKKGFIIKYPISTKFLIRLNINDLF